MEFLKRIVSVPSWTWLKSLKRKDKHWNSKQLKDESTKASLKEFWTFFTIMTISHIQAFQSTSTKTSMEPWMISLGQSKKSTKKSQTRCRLEIFPKMNWTRKKLKKMRISENLMKLSWLTLKRMFVSPWLQISMKRHHKIYWA